MSLQNKTIAFIGAGNMAEALIKGLLAVKAVAARQLTVTDIRPERLEFLAQTYGVGINRENAPAVAGADIVVLAVKPQQMSEALASCRAAMSPGRLVVSIAAGVTTARLERELGGTPRVVRSMPNTPALVGAGTAALAKGKFATDDDLATAEAILGAVGITVRTDEKLLDAVTALSGSGPAYLFFVTEAMTQGGINAGLTPELAQRLAIQTVYGAAKLLVDSGESPESLRRKVTSPGGTTEAALKVMTDRQLPDIFTEAIQAATRRSQELSAS